MKIVLLLVLLPVLIQMSLMYVRHDTFSISAKGNTTFKVYFLAQCYASVNEIKIEDAVSAVENYSPDTMITFMLENKKTVAINFLKNIIFENLTGPATFLVYPPEYKNMTLFNIMKLENRLFLILHLLFLIPCLYLLFHLLKTKSRLLGAFCFLLFLFYYLVLITGIAYWQGDRYAVSFQPLWIIIYLFVISEFRNCSFHLFKIKVSGK